MEVDHGLVADTGAQTLIRLANLLNPIQVGGHNVPRYKFLPCCAKTVCKWLMKLSDF